MSRRVSDLQLERYLAEALTPTEVAQVEALLQASLEDQQALAALRADTAALFVKVPPAAFAHRVAPTPATSATRAPWWRWAGAFTASMALVAAIVSLRLGRDDDDLRTKGSTAWRITIAHGQTLQIANEHTVLHDGDVLSFEVTSSAKAFAAVISRAPDGFQMYAPASGTLAEPVSAGVNTLHDAAALDSTTGDEVLYLLVSTQQFDPTEARRALEADPTRTQWNSVVIERRAFKKE